MPSTFRSSLSLLGAALLLTSSAPAFQTSLSDESIREAYFLGQRNDATTASFFNPYLRLLPKPDKGAFIAEVEVYTPYVQLVETSRRRSMGYSAQQAALDYRHNQHKLYVRVRIDFTPTYGALESLPLLQSRPRTNRHRSALPRFLPRLPRRPLPALRPRQQRPVDRAPSHPSPAFLHTKLKSPFIYPGRPSLLFLRRRLGLLLIRLLHRRRGHLSHRLARLARIRRPRRRLRRRPSRSHHHRRPARRRPLRPLHPPLTRYHSFRSPTGVNAYHSYYTSASFPLIFHW